MKNYYYEENGLQLGTFKIEELKGKITHKTKVWTEGLSDWVEASKIPDLREILSLSTPPPLNKTKKKSILKIGIFLIFLIILIIFILKYKSLQEEKNFYSNSLYAKIGEQENRKDQEIREKEFIRENWIDYIKLSRGKLSIDYDFGGIDNFEVYVSNGTNYYIDIVEVTVLYVKANGELWKENKLYFKNIPPQGVETLIAPSSSRGTKVSYYISYIRSDSIELEEKIGDEMVEF